MVTDFVLQENCTRFLLNRGLRVYLDLYLLDFPKKFLNHFFYILVTFSPKHPILEAFLGKKHPNHLKSILATKKMENLDKNTFKIWVLKSLNGWSVQNKSLRKHCIRKWHIAVKTLYPLFLTTLVKSKYWEVLMGQSGAYKPEGTLKTFVSQNVMHLTWRTKSVPRD